MDRRAVAVGVAVVTVGILLAVAPEVAATLGLDLPTLSIALVGLVCLLLAYLGVQSRRRTSFTYTDVPEVETRRSFDRPGSDFASDLDAVRRNPRAGRWRERVHDRLHEAAIDALTAEGNSESRAADRLASGEWTDDPDAAAFFATNPRTRTWRERARTLVSDEPTFVRRARRVVAVLDRRTDGPTADPEPGESE